jgi:hypothetical protein
MLDLPSPILLNEPSKYASENKHLRKRREKERKRKKKRKAGEAEKIGP